MNLCSYAGCGRPHYARTLCHTHYSQQRRGGALRAVQRQRPKGSAGVRDQQGRKLCPRCELWHPTADFNPDAAASDGLTTYCRPCRSAQARAWRYGLEPQQIETMVRNQGGNCALCPTSLAIGFCVDHDHGCCPGVKTCGQCVRGLLCQECNKLIGKLESDRPRMDRLLNYIGR